MSLFRELIESLLLESTLTKGSQRVMNDKKLVAGIADTLRDDVRINPSAFPPGSKEKFQKASNEVLADWFLENLDRIERAGYEGTVYSRDGVNSEWISRKYISGAHSWEDITGVMNMNLRDWYLMKNRGMLDPKHQDLWKFNGVRDLGYYITTHYEKGLKDVRDAAAKAARVKMSKSVKLVDNEDYRVYVSLNRAAGCALGLGTQWCTANTSSGTYFHRYAGRAMLFQMIPYEKQKDAEGKIVPVLDKEGKSKVSESEKYQFDAGDEGGQAVFMDITDRPVAPKTVAEKFPYLYSDLAKGLKANKESMEKAFEELSLDPSLQHEDYKIKTYKIDEEIKKLKKFEDAGYFTDKVRPSKKPEEEKPLEQAAQAPQEPGLEQKPEQGQETMEEVDKDVADMLNNLKKLDILKESVAPVLERGNVKDWEKKDDKKDGKKPEWLYKKEVEAEKKEGKKVEEEKEVTKTHKGGEVTKTDTGLKHKSGGAYGGDKDHDKKHDDDKDDLEEAADADVIAWMGRLARLGNMGPDKR